jgi:hypothetical protein
MHLSRSCKLSHASPRISGRTFTSLNYIDHACTSLCNQVSHTYLSWSSHTPLYVVQSHAHHTSIIRPVPCTPLSVNPPHEYLSRSSIPTYTSNIFMVQCTPPYTNIHTTHTHLLVIQQLTTILFEDLVPRTPPSVNSHPHIHLSQLEDRHMHFYWSFGRHTHM